MSLPTELAGRLRAARLDPDDVEHLVRAALAEDLGGGEDVTTLATVPATHRSTAHVVARAGGVVAGLAVAEVALRCAPGAADVHVEQRAVDGQRVSRGDVLLVATGLTRALLSGERVALNLLCHLSGVATATRAWVDALSGTRATVRDTRKTTPLLRALEKYAVRCGGGLNHRMSLADAALVKDNHVVVAGGVAAAFRAVRRRAPGVSVEVEVTDVRGAVAAVEAGADLVLLDNMSLEAMRGAVDEVRGRARLEASGGLTLERARLVAETGVDYLAVGALTHSAPILDVAMDLVEG